jgi:Uma2 family endonuclease
MLAERKTNPIKDGHFKLTPEMFEALSDAGHFADKHVELLDGEMFVKGLQSKIHAYVIQNLSQLFYAALAQEAVIRPQLPLVLLNPPPDFVEPDLALLRLPSEQYKTRNADSSDPLLVIEVSDSTLERDQTATLRAYARDNIPEYWILNLHAQQLEVRRDPSGEDYLETRKYKVGQSVATLEFSDALFEWWV